MKKLAVILAVAAGVFFAPAAAKAESLAFNPNVLIVTSKPLYAPAKYKHGHDHRQHQYRHHIKHVQHKQNYKKQCAPRHVPAYYRPHARPVVWWYR